MSITHKDPLVCPARVTLDADQVAFLDKLPSAAPSLQSELGCELEHGHVGSHAALGQRVDDTMWWVQWTLTASEIKPFTWCSAKDETTALKDRDGNPCVLFDGHPGRHSDGDAYWAEGVEEAA
jgi:hypothetical protein